MVLRAWGEGRFARPQKALAGGTQRRGQYPDGEPYCEATPWRERIRRRRRGAWRGRFFALPKRRGNATPVRSARRRLARAELAAAPNTQWRWAVLK